MSSSFCLIAKATAFPQPLFALFQCIHLFCYLFEVFTDGKALRTDLLTFSAGLTFIGPLTLRQILEIILSGDLFVSIHGEIIPDPEVLRNIDTVRTRHTISTAGTAVLGPCLDGCCRFLYDLFLFLI